MKRASIEFLKECPSYPGIIKPQAGEQSLIDFCESQKSEIQDLLNVHGGLLFRGWDMPDHQTFGAVVNAVTSRPWEGLSQLFAIRSPVEGVVFTASDYPMGARLYPHSEFSHNALGNWPMRAYFYCEIPAEGGGETPLADMRAVFRKMPFEILEEFTRRGLRYYRSLFHDERSWQMAFGSEDSNNVEKSLEAAGVEFKWGNGGKDLHMEWPLHAIARHPVSGDAVWFNQAINVCADNISVEIKKTYEARWGAGARPMDVTFADGERIPAELLKEIVDLVDSETVAFQWQRGDVLMLDNMLIGHGKNAHRGERRTLVALGEPADNTTVWTH